MKRNLKNLLLNDHENTSFTIIPNTIHKDFGCCYNYYSCNYTNKL